MARAGTIEGVTCREQIDELTATLQSKLLFRPDQLTDTTIDLLTFLRIVPITGRLRAVANDPDDDKTLECAVAARATHIVTGDRRHLLPLQSFRGIPIVTAAEFLAVAANP